MQINKMTARNWALDQYNLNSGGVNINRVKQLQKDKGVQGNDSSSAVNVTISEQAKDLNNFRLKNSDE